MKKRLYKGILFVFLFLGVFSFTSIMAEAKGTMTNKGYIYKVTFTGTGTYDYQLMDKEPCDYCHVKHNIRMKINLSWKIVYPMVLFSDSSIAAFKTEEQDMSPMASPKYPLDIVCSFYYEQGFCETVGDKPVYITHKIPDGKGTDTGWAVYLYAKKSKTPGSYDITIQSINDLKLTGNYIVDGGCSCSLRSDTFDRMLDSFINFPKEALEAKFFISAEDIKKGKSFSKNVACTVPHPNEDNFLTINDLGWTGKVTFEAIDLTKMNINK